MRSLLLSMLIGCGGAVAGPIVGEDAGDAASADASGDAAGDSPFVKDASGVDCKALEAKIAARREELKVCCPFCGTIQCSHVTQDLCCPFSTTATDTADFDKMVAQYNKSCMPICPDVVCPPVPSNVCMPGMNSQGTCK